MSNIVEYRDKIAVHPGYYIKEIVEESGLTQEDFAKRLGTTPKNLSILLRGEQNLSIDLAAKMSRMLGTTAAYWLRLQQAYDEKVASFLSEEELKHEREVFALMDYPYFCENFGLPKLPSEDDEQIRHLREFLSVSSLRVLEEPNLAVSFRRASDSLSKSNMVNANAMVQIAVNQTLRTEAPKYNKNKFEKAASFALTQTKNHEGFLHIVTEAFLNTGVVLVVLPNLKDSGINGATKRVNGKVMLMVNDRSHYADAFWFTLFHEIGHILNGELGISLKDEAEDAADLYARRVLIPQDLYEDFLHKNNRIDEETVLAFAKTIDQDPGIVVGRLMKDGIINGSEKERLRRLRHLYKVMLV